MIAHNPLYVKNVVYPSLPTYSCCSVLSYFHITESISIIPAIIAISDNLYNQGSFPILKSRSGFLINIPNLFYLGSFPRTRLFYLSRFVYRTFLPLNNNKKMNYIYINFISQI